MSAILNVFKTFSSHPSDPATPGHLPSEGRLGVFDSLKSAYRFGGTHFLYQ